jgi:tight adherence protein C
MERVQDPLLGRIVGPALGGLKRSLGRLYPSGDIDRVHAELLKAGLTGSVRAEEFVAIQVGSVLLGIGAGLIALVSGATSLKIGLAILVILPLIGGLGPSYWLRHRIKVRREQVTNDLPDVLDLMTISVAAGLGLEQAMQVSCARFESPVSDELRLALREMELGLSRHDALENMKLRTDIDDLVTLSVVLSQADALGLPIGRVLQAQADEMRDKRRQRAREKAAKVPVKILFPLALCFLPAILIVVLGPIVPQIMHALHMPHGG